MIFSCIPTDLLKNKQTTARITQMKTKNSREIVVAVTIVIIFNLLSGMGAATSITVVSSSVFEPGSVVALVKLTG